ncbi:MAG TPA: hypothetical protein VL069_05890 [Opitutus sp.]|nr:hypothetical protein [Opitutus sp.]
MASSSNRPPSSLEARILRWWLAVCVVVGLTLCVSQLLEIPARSALRGYDNTFNYLWLRSAMVDGDWDFRNDLQECDTLPPEYRASALGLPVTANGRIPNKYGIGWAVLTLPFFAVADGLVWAGRELNLWTYQNDGFNPVYQVCIQIGHAGLALLALWMAIRTVTDWIGNREAALAGVVTTWAASPLIYYQTANVSMSHGAAFFAISSLAYALFRVRHAPDRKRWWLVAGASLGLAIVVRYQLAIFALPAAWSLWQLRPEFRRLTWAAGCFAMAVLPFLMLQSWAWRVVYGEWFVFSYGAEGESFHWNNPELVNSFFSPRHGLFYWHPFLLIGAVGMLAWAWRVRGAAIPWISCVALIAYVNAAWWCWWFASSFGNRGYDAALLPFMAGGGFLMLSVKGRARSLLWGAAIILGLWNFYAVWLYRAGAISRSEPVTWWEMVKAVSRLSEATKF